MKKILVIGASGFLGRHLLARAESRFDLTAACSSSKIESSCKQISINLCDTQSIERAFSSIEFDAVINCAAINPGRGNQEEMELVNELGAEAVAKACMRHQSRLVHISTDAVHDGKRAPYGDDDQPSPITRYGRSKALGEGLVARACPGSLIIRTSLIYSHRVMDHGTRSFVERLKRGEPLHLFTDCLRQPIHASDLSEVILDLVDSPESGFLNVAGPEVLSRDEFGRKVLPYWGISADSAQSVAAHDISPDIPLDCRLDLAKLTKVTSYLCLSVDAHLQRS